MARFLENLKKIVKDFGEERNTAIKRKEYVSKFCKEKFLKYLSDVFKEEFELEKNLTEDYKKMLEQFITKAKKAEEKFETESKKTTYTESQSKKVLEALNSVIEYYKKFTSEDRKKSISDGEIYVDIESFLTSKKILTENTNIQLDYNYDKNKDEAFIVYTINANNDKADFKLEHSNKDDLNTEIDKIVKGDNTTIKNINSQVCLEDFLKALEKIIYTYNQEIERAKSINTNTNSFIKDINKILSSLLKSYKEAKNILKERETVKTNKQTGKDENVKIEKLSDKEVNDVLRGRIEEYLGIMTKEGGVGKGEILGKFISFKDKEKDLNAYCNDSTSKKEEIKKIADVVLFIKDGLDDICDASDISSIPGWSDAIKEANSKIEKEETKQINEEQGKQINVIEEKDYVFFEKDDNKGSVEKIKLKMNNSSLFINGDGYIKKDDLFYKDENKNIIYFKVFDSVKNSNNKNFDDFVKASKFFKININETKIENIDEISKNIDEISKNNVDKNGGQIFKKYLEYYNNYVSNVNENIKKIIENKNSTLDSIEKKYKGEQLTSKKNSLKNTIVSDSKKYWNGLSGLVWGKINSVCHDEESTKEYIDEIWERRYSAGSSNSGVESEEDSIEEVGR